MQNYKNYTDFKLDDLEVIERILGGDKDFYGLIMKKYNQRLFRIGRSIINDEDEVEDILQETYLKAYENLRNFGRRSQFSTWLTKILINEALNRRNKRNRLASMDEADEGNLGINNSKSFNMTTTNLNPEEQAINNELKESLEQVIDKLPEKYRTVYVMREIEGMSVAETGECLNISEANVKVRLNRAKEMLRNSLTNIYKESEIFQFLGSRCDRIISNVLNALNEK